MKFIKRVTDVITAYHCALLHLVLIGIPARFGLVPAGLFHKSLGIASPCSMFEHPEGKTHVCNKLEDFSIKEFGYRFILHYQLAIVACYVINSASQDRRAKEGQFQQFNMTLANISIITLLSLASLQAKGRATYEPHLFARIVLYRLIAILMSQWAVFRRSVRRQPKVAAWTIPGLALLVGAAVNVYISFNSIQIFARDGLGKYFVTQPGNGQELTPIVASSFLLGVLHTILDVILLLSLRDIFSRDQLRAVCGYKVVLHVILPFFWLPERSGFLHVNVAGAHVLRVVLILNYGAGYFLAGKMDKVGNILAGQGSAPRKIE